MECNIKLCEEKKKRFPLIIMLAFTLREYSCSRWGVCHMGLLLVKPFRHKWSLLREQKEIENLQRIGADNFIYHEDMHTKCGLFFYNGSSLYWFKRFSAHLVADDDKIPIELDFNLFLTDIMDYLHILLPVINGTRIISLILVLIRVITVPL